MKTEVVITLESFFIKELGIVTDKNELEKREIKTPEEFILNVIIEKEKLLEVLDKYFNIVDGSYNLIRSNNKFTLDFLYEIKSEKGLCLLNIIKLINELWVKTTIFV